MIIQGEQNEPDKRIFFVKRNNFSFLCFSAVTRNKCTIYFLSSLSGDIFRNANNLKILGDVITRTAKQLGIIVTVYLIKECSRNIVTTNSERGQVRPLFTYFHPFQMKYVSCGRQRHSNLG